MKTLRIDHIGIAVNSAEEASKLYGEVLGLETETEILEDRNLKVVMVELGGSRVELLEDLVKEDGMMTKYIEKRGEGLHHMAVEVDNINETVETMKANGYRVLSEPKPGANGTVVVFVHPKDTNGVLLELVERRK